LRDIGPSSGRSFHIELAGADAKTAINGGSCPHFDVAFSQTEYDAQKVTEQKLREIITTTGYKVVAEEWSSFQLVFDGKAVGLAAPECGKAATARFLCIDPVTEQSQNRATLGLV
jgi:hypothetical protein